MKQTQLGESVIKYFLNLGYQRESFAFEISLQPNAVSDFSLYRDTIDFAILINGLFHVVVEIRSELDLAQINNENTPHNPLVRQVQTYSNAVQSPYFVLTNGNDFVWFQTGKSGRPHLIEPQYNENGKQQDHNQSTSYRVIINECMKILKVDSTSSNVSYELLLMMLSVIVIGKEIVFKGAYEVEKLLSRFLNFDITGTLVRLKKETLELCFRYLASLEFGNLTSKEALNILNLVLMNHNDKMRYRVPYWLSEFLVNLCSVKTTSLCYDPFANYGEIQTAISVFDGRIKTYGSYWSVEGAVFSALQHLLLGKHTDGIDLYENTDSHLKRNISPDAIISILPIGVKVNTSINVTSAYEYRYQYLADLLLVQSLELLRHNGRLVILTSESFLFGRGKRMDLRDHILNHYSLRAIISLPSGIFQPYSNVKTCVLVIDKKYPEENNVFIAQLDNILKLGDDQSLTDIPSVNNLLKEFSAFLENDTMEKSIDNIRIMSSHFLQENWSVDTYLDDLKSADSPSFPLYQLRNLSLLITKGTNIKLNRLGSVSVLGPAAIRPLEIIEENMGKTTSENIDANCRLAQKNDVVINSISTHLGASAVVENEDKLNVSQHVIIVRPDTQKVIPYFLAMVLNSRFVQNKLKGTASGSVIPALQVTKIREIFVPIPPIEMQIEIVKRVKELKKSLLKIEEEKKLVEKALNRIIDDFEVVEDDK